MHHAPRYRGFHRMTTQHAPTANMSLDERQQFEKLLAEYANAEMDVVRSAGRRHIALHACIDFINARTNVEVREAFKAGADYGYEMPRPPSPPNVPTGTMRIDRLEPISNEHLDMGAMHLKGIEGLPVDCCQCATCCEVRSLAYFKNHL